MTSETKCDSELYLYRDKKCHIVGYHNQDGRGYAAMCRPQMLQVLKDSTKLPHEYNNKINVTEEILATIYLL